MGEHWKRIGETNYYVSNCGQVASVFREKWRVLKASRASHGYLQVGIHGRARRVHTVVAEEFLGPPPTPRHEVNHKDGDKSNNHADNLEWVTHQENIDHIFDVLGTRKRKMAGPKARSCAFKLTAGQVKTIMERLESGESQTAIANDMPVGQSHISRIARGRVVAWRVQEI